MMPPIEPPSLPDIPELDNTPEWHREPKLSPEQSEAMIKLYKENFSFLVPVYDKLSLLLMAVTLALLFITNSQSRIWIQKEDFAQDYLFFVTNKSIVLRVIFGIVPIFLSALFGEISIRRKRVDFKKMIMLFFAVYTNAITAIVAGTYCLKNASVSNWLLAFPIWNIINGFLLLIMFRCGIINEDCIIERKVKLFEVILSMAAVLVIFVLCNYVFKLYWAITFSICIVYSTSFNKALQSVFPSLTYSPADNNKQC